MNGFLRLRSKLRKHGLQVVRHPRSRLSKRLQIAFREQAL